MEKLNFGDVLISYDLDLEVKLTLDAWKQAKPAIQYLEHKITETLKRHLDDVHYLERQLTEKHKEIQELERTISAQKLDIAEYELYTKWKEGEPARKNAIRRAKYANKRDAEQIRINEKEERSEYANAYSRIVRLNGTSDIIL